MKPINCGVFDEVSRRCIHCGEIQEGSQCTYDYTWKRGEFTLHAARLLYGSMALHDAATDTVTIIDRTETPYDPMQHAVQAYRLLHKLVLNHRCVVQYSTDYSRFLITTDRGNVRYLPRPLNGGEPVGIAMTYPLSTRSSDLAWALIVMAAKLQLANSSRLWPTNLCKEEVPLILTFERETR